mmetsp:Transcript_44800/g.104394  ORF Transcript_44800/g.104394 Transcript_44800/m.104394 type:complete len:219 (-) Transcript_44800:21-677(-)
MESYAHSRTSWGALLLAIWWLGPQVEQESSLPGVIFTSLAVAFAFAAGLPVLGEALALASLGAFPGKVTVTATNEAAAVVGLALALATALAFALLLLPVNRLLMGFFELALRVLIHLHLLLCMSSRLGQHVDQRADDIVHPGLALRLLADEDLQRSWVCEARHLVPIQAHISEEISDLRLAIRADEGRLLLQQAVLHQDVAKSVCKILVAPFLLKSHG